MTEGAASSELRALVAARARGELGAWSPDASLIVGLTPIGRATIAALALNRAGLLNLRRVLSRAGEHPPR